MATEFVLCRLLCAHPIYSYKRSINVHVAVFMILFSEFADHYIVINWLFCSHKAQMPSDSTHFMFCTR